MESTDPTVWNNRNILLSWGFLIYNTRESMSARYRIPELHEFSHLQWGRGKNGQGCTSETLRKILHFIVIKEPSRSPSFSNYNLEWSRPAAQVLITLDFFFFFVFLLYWRLCSLNSIFHICVCVSTYVCLCVYVCICVYMCVCIYPHECVYIYTHTILIEL